MSLLQIVCTPNSDFDAELGDLPTIHTVIGDGTSTVEQDLDGNTLANYLSDIPAFKTNVVRPAFKECRVATLLANSFSALQSITLDESTVETEAIAVILAKIPE